jgi:hypothetical protein
VSDEQGLILRVALTPLALGAVAALLCSLPRLPDAVRQISAALAICGAVLMVFWFERGLPTFPPTRTLNWLWPVAGAAVLTVILSSLIPRGRWWFLAATLLFVLWTHSTRGGKFHEHAGVWVAMILCAAGWAMSLLTICKTMPGRMGRLALSGILGALAVTLLLTKSLLLAQLAGAMACALLGLAVCARPLCAGLYAPMVCMAVFLCLHGYLFSRMQFAEMLLLAFGGLLVLAYPLAKRFFPGWMKSLVAAGLSVAVPAATALWVLMRVRPWENPYF